MVVANNPFNQISKEYMKRARSFEEYCNYDWGRIGYNSLVEGIEKIGAPKLMSNTQPILEGFASAFHI